jgi:hypothetical protein
MGQTRTAPAPARDASAEAPASAGTDAPATNAADVLADFRIAPARKVIYSFEHGAPRADVPALRANDSAPAPVITRGKHERSGVPVLALVNGDNVQALPLAAIGAAIAHGVISREEIAALLGN